MSRLEFDRRMSDAEGLMWRLEKDPFLSSNIGNVTILDRPLDVDRLRRRLERATAEVPRLRQRVQPGPVNATPPTWVDDPDFDINYHVRHLALPAPGRMRDLLDLAPAIAADPFDRTRPLWGFVVLDGLEGGRSVLLQRYHHTVVDGEAGVRVSLQFMDLEPDPPEPPTPEPAAVSEPAPAVPAPPPASPGEAFRDVVTGTMRMPIGLARQALDLLCDPARIPAASAAARQTMGALVKQLSDTERARSPLWTARTLKRGFEVLRVPLDPVKTAAKALGATLNVAFIAAAASAAGAYHRELGSPVDQLRASMAVSTRTASSGANAYTLARMLVPTGEMPMAERIAFIIEAAVSARASSMAASLDTVAAAATTLPTSLVTRIARQQTQTVDFATSNVRAAPFPLYIAGAHILENYPIGPLGGVAFNLTLLSYDGSLDMGLHVDSGAIAEPGRLRDALANAFEEIVAAG
jgi:WS/DGAT/MGAT family acyltransferase